MQPSPLLKASRLPTCLPLVNQFHYSWYHRNHFECRWQHDTCVDRERCRYSHQFKPEQRSGRKHREKPNIMKTQGEYDVKRTRFTSYSPCVFINELLLVPVPSVGWAYGLLMPDRGVRQRLCGELFLQSQGWCASPPLSDA